jgi:hypothetical protein
MKAYHSERRERVGGMCWYTVDYSIFSNAKTRMRMRWSALFYENVKLSWRQVKARSICGGEGPSFHCCFAVVGGALFSSKS